jgi:hypothetical protein
MDYKLDAHAVVERLRTTAPRTGTSSCSTMTEIAPCMRWKSCCRSGSAPDSVSCPWSALRSESHPEHNPPIFRLLVYLVILYLRASGICNQSLLETPIVDLALVCYRPLVGGQEKRFEALSTV